MKSWRRQIDEVGGEDKLQKRDKSRGNERLKLEESEETNGGSWRKRKSDKTNEVCW